MTYINSKSSTIRAQFRSDSLKPVYATGSFVFASANSCKYSLAQGKMLGKTSGVIKFDLSPGFVIVFLALMAILFGLMFLFTHNQVATKGYELKKLQMSRQELKNQHDLINLYLAKSQSYESILANAKLLPMRKPGGFEYVLKGDSFIAKSDR